MYGKEYIDWLENERHDRILCGLSVCEASFDGHSLRSYADGCFSGYKCQHCGLMMGEMVGGVG